MERQHSLTERQRDEDGGIKINAGDAYDVVSYADPDGVISVVRHTPNAGHAIFAWDDDHGYDVRGTWKRRGYRFLGAYVVHPRIRSQQVAKTLWDEEGISDWRSKQWARLLESYSGPRSGWPRGSLNGCFDTDGRGVRSKMTFPGPKGTYYPTEALPKYVQEARSRSKAERLAWTPAAKAAEAAE